MVINPYGEPLKVNLWHWNVKGVVILGFWARNIVIVFRDGCCFGSRWLLEMDFWLFVDSWDFRNLTCIGEAVFWVFWWWFVGCLVVEEVVLALSVEVSDWKPWQILDRASNRKYSPTIQTITNPNGEKVNTHLMQHISKYQLKLTVGSL